MDVRIAQPVGAAFAPFGAVGHESRRTGDDDPGEALAARQRIAAFDIRHHGLVGFQPGREVEDWLEAERRVDREEQEPALPAPPPLSPRDQRMARERLASCQEQPIEFPQFRHL
mgnify:CR=1 FL=1